MKIYCNGTAEIQHKETKEIYTFESDAISWDCVSGEERQMGPEYIYEAILEHPELGEIRWELSEYPAGVENYRDTSILDKHTILKDFSFGLEHDENESDDWLDNEVENNPFENFMKSYNDSLELVYIKTDKKNHPILYRMLYSQQVTALEAYLGDTLISKVNTNQKILQSLLEKDNEIKKFRYSLLEISANPNLIKEAVTHYLRSILYHNLKKVDSLYKNAFDFSPLSLASNPHKMLDIIHLRHDCVHRNGLNKEGDPHQITKEELLDVCNIIKDFVISIQKLVKLDEEASAI